MTIDQHTPETTQDDINARLALISKAVEEKLLSRQQVSATAETSEQEESMLVVSTCPIDPMERLLCESCQ